MSQYSLKTGSTNVSGQNLGFAHGLPVTPDIVLIQKTGTAADNFSVQNITATTVDIYGGASANFQAVAIKVS